MEALDHSIDLNVVAEITLAHRPKVKPDQRPKVDCSKQVYEFLRQFWNKDSLEYIE